MRNSALCLHPVPQLQFKGTERRQPHCRHRQRASPPPKPVSLTLSFLCHSSASRRFNILTLRAAESGIFFTETVTRKKQLRNSPSFLDVPPPLHPTFPQGIRILEHTPHKGHPTGQEQLSMRMHRCSPHLGRALQSGRGTRVFHGWGPCAPFSTCSGSLP